MSFKLFRRKNKNNKDEKTPTKMVEVDEKIQETYDTITKNVSTPLRPYLEAAGPVIVSGATIIQQCIPYLIIIYEQVLILIKELEPYHLDKLVPTLIGLLLCFYGGTFFTIIAAVEAYRMTGYQTSLDALTLIHNDIQNFIKVSIEDDKVDADGDGKNDTSELTAQELVTRKSFLFLRTVDPEKLATALHGLQAGLLAVAATLKLQLAKSLTLGTALANIVEEPVNKYIKPSLEAGLPEEYKRWAAPLCHTTIKIVTVSTAWWLHRVIEAVHSAMRGGQMIGLNVLNYLRGTKFLPEKLDPDDTIIDEVIGYTVAGAGLWFQLRYNFCLPFPLNVLLFPLSLLEWSLMWLVNSV